MLCILMGEYTVQIYIQHMQCTSQHNCMNAIIVVKNGVFTLFQFTLTQEERTEVAPVVVKRKKLQGQREKMIAPKHLAKQRRHEKSRIFLEYSRRYFVENLINDMASCGAECIGCCIVCNNCSGDVAMFKHQTAFMGHDASTQQQVNEVFA